MMNTLTSRLLNVALIVSALVLSPQGAFAQDAAAAVDPTASNFIGGLVIWLLPIGGIFAVFVMIAMDKGAQASRTGNIRR